MHQPRLPHPKAKHSAKPKILDETTREKIRKHMSDINDVITDEDIKKIQIDIFRPYTKNEKQKAG